MGSRWGVCPVIKHAPGTPTFSCNDLNVSGGGRALAVDIAPMDMECGHGVRVRERVRMPISDLNSEGIPEPED